MSCKNEIADYRDSLYNIPPGTKGFIKHNTQEKAI